MEASLIIFKSNKMHMEILRIYLERPFSKHLLAFESCFLVNWQLSSLWSLVLDTQFGAVFLSIFLTCGLKSVTSSRETCLQQEESVISEGERGVGAEAGYVYILRVLFCL